MQQVVIDHTSAVVDTDFLSHVAEMKRTINELISILDHVFTEVEIRPAIHPLVYENEISPTNQRMNAFFDHHIILRPSFEDIFQGDETKQLYYRYLFSELYHMLRGEDFSPEQDVFTYWKRQNSLGEIHSVAMCLICGCSVFLSDDRDSKVLQQLVKERLLGRVHVYNRKEFLAQYLSSDTISLSRQDRRAFSHA